MDGVAAVARVLLECAEAFGIVGPAVAKARAKQLLQLGKAGEAQRLGEPHQGRGLRPRCGRGPKPCRGRTRRGVQARKRRLGEDAWASGRQSRSGGAGSRRLLGWFGRCLVAHRFPRDQRDASAPCAILAMSIQIEQIFQSIGVEIFVLAGAPGQGANRGGEQCARSASD